MSSDDYQVQNIKYNRKSYKKINRRSCQPNEITQDDYIENEQCSPRKDDARTELPPSCNCDLDPDDVANILHKKCPVITLAQEQLRRRLEQTNEILCDNTRCRRSIYDFIDVCREVLLTRNKYLSFLVLFLFIAFFLGLLLGAGSCGTYARRFNSPILSCLDTYLTSNTINGNQQEYRWIV